MIHQLPNAIAKVQNEFAKEFPKMLDAQRARGIAPDGSKMIYEPSTQKRKKRRVVNKWETGQYRRDMGVLRRSFGSRAQLISVGAKSQRSRNIALWHNITGIRYGKGRTKTKFMPDLMLVQSSRLNLRKRLFVTLRRNLFQGARFK